MMIQIHPSQGEGGGGEKEKKYGKMEKWRKEKTKQNKN